MKTSQFTKVKPVADEKVLLDDSLRPLWMFVSWNRFLPDFSGQEENRTFYIVRSLMISSVVLIALSYTSFESFQFVTETLKNESKHNGVIVLCFLFVGLYSLVSQYQLCMHQKEIRQFLKGWKMFEMKSLKYSRGIKNKKAIKLFYAMYLVIICQIILTVFFWNFWYKSAPFFLSYLELFRKYLSTIQLCLITTFVQYFVHVYTFMAEIVPSLFYYHAGCAVEDIRRELEHIVEVFYSKSSNLKQPALLTDGIYAASKRHVARFRCLWEKYETITRWVTRANQLFGTLLIFCYSGTFILCSFTSYMAIHNFSQEPFLSLGFTGVFLLLALRISFVNRLASQMIFSCSKLKLATALILSQKWDVLPKEDRSLLIHFHTRLNKEELAASPFYMYSVNPNNLLSMFSLIVTYAAVFLQF